MLQADQSLRSIFGDAVRNTRVEQHVEENLRFQICYLRFCRWQFMHIELLRNWVDEQLFGRTLSVFAG